MLDEMPPLWGEMPLLRLLTKQQLTGVLVAPLAAPIAGFLLMYVFFSVNFQGIAGFFMSYEAGWIILFYAMFIGAPVSYGVSVIFGIPVLKILEKINRVNFFSIVASAGILGTVPLIVMLIVHKSSSRGFGNIYMDLWTLFILVYFLSLGVIVGIVFWFIVYRYYGQNPWKDILVHRSLSALSMVFGFVLIPTLLIVSLNRGNLLLGEHLEGSQFLLYIHAIAIAIAIICMALLVEERYITKQYAIQFSSILKYSDFRNEFTALFGVVSISLVWILGNGIFLIAYAWAMRSISMKEEIYKAILLSGQILSGIGYFFGMFLSLVVQAFLLYCSVSLLYSLYITVFKKDMKNIFYCRKLFVFWGACSIMLLILIYIAPVALFYINKSFIEEIDQRTQPLFASIESFINDHNRPPDSLQELVPGYMDSRSLMVFEKYPYDYKMISVDEEKLGALYVSVHCLEPFFMSGCKMVRLAGQHYSHPDMVESLPHPDSSWSYNSWPLNGFVMGYEIDAFANKDQYWSYHVWSFRSFPY